MPHPKIAVIGAGPAGLTFARLLQINHLPCTVYEAEKDRTERNQGGTLDLHPKAGQLALKEAGLFEDFQKYARPEGQALKLIKYTGELIWDENEVGDSRPEEYDDRPEIDRMRLRDILLDSIEPRRIRWGHKVTRVESNAKDKSKHNIHFADGTQEFDFDLIVGADGAWSKVRLLVTDVKPYYSGISAVELWNFNVSEKNPRLDKHTGEGSNFMFDEGRAVMCQRSSGDAIRVYACVRQPENWKHECGIDWADHDAARQALVDGYFSDCGEDIKQSILYSRDECILRQLWMLPVGHRWNHTAGITLLGDSAHLMTPFAGVGVNLAMRDALDLARELISKKESFFAKAFSHVHNIDAAVKSYEKEMFSRSETYAQKSYDGMIEHFSRNGGQLMVDKVKGK